MSHNHLQLSEAFKAALGAAYQGSSMVDDKVGFFGTLSPANQAKVDAIIAAHVPDPLYGKPDHIALRTFDAKAVTTLADVMAAMKASARIRIAEELRKEI